MLVPASIGGVAVHFVLDTGAEGILLEPAMAEMLQLPLRGMTRIHGSGGSQDARLVLLPGLRLGGAAVAAQVVPVAPLPIRLDAVPPVAGLLGSGVLLPFDLDLDVPGRRLGLSLAGDCPTPPGIVLPLELTRSGEAFFPVRVNGQMLVAQLDTGTRPNLMTTAAARRLGIEIPTSANSARGIDGRAIPLGHVQVRLALGDGPEVVTPVSVGPVQVARGDMLLGLATLGLQRVWIGYGRREISVARRPPSG